MSKPRDLPELSVVELCRASGGANVCTPENPTGASEPTQFLENANPGGKSVSESVIENTDRAMAPWKLFNGIFGGARGPAPNMPAPSRPTYR
jgi:hypothetical protein